MDFFRITLFFTILGAVSSGIGGVISSMIKTKSKVVISSLYEITAGLMTGIVCFDMIPESFYLAHMLYTILGIICGILIVYSIDYLIVKSDTKCKKNYNTKFLFNYKPKNRISKTALVVMISMGLHNMIEGLAIGSGFSYSYSLGFSILITMFFHDIPEGLVVAITNMEESKNTKKVIFNSVLEVACVGVGCLIGLIVGKIDDKYIAFCLSVAAGAMLYIVSCDLLVMSKKITSSKLVALMYIVGIVFAAMIN